MFPRLVPVATVSAALAFAVAAGSLALMPERPRLWSAVVALVVLGAITPAIYAVNIRIVPVFSSRVWQSARALAATIVLAMIGGWLTFLGRAGRVEWLETIGSLAAFAAGLLFIGSIIRLFRSSVTSPVAPPLPYPEQAEVDRIGVRFTRIAGMYLILGLALGVLLRWWSPADGRWELVWAHSLLLGWFVNMASGVSYHVLTRWTSRRWRHPRLISVHLRIIHIALPLMLIALALDHRWLLAAGGVLQAVGLLLYAWNVLPLFGGLPSLSRIGMTAAVIFLILGVLIGASFALDPVNHVRLRFTHATINLFGFAALLVAGAGYYLFPRFAGQPLRWPRLAAAQLATQISGVVVLATALWWYMRGGDYADTFVMLGGLMTMAGLLGFTTILAGTFFAKRRPGGGTVSSIQVKPLPLIRPGR